MCPYYEVIFEPGDHSLAYYDDDTTANTSLLKHQEMAKDGTPATPPSEERTDLSPSDTAVGDSATWNAQRIERVLVYEEHPASYVPTSNPQEIAASMPDATPEEVAAAIRASTSPFVNPEGPHDSVYAMQADRELEWVNQ